MWVKYRSWLGVEFDLVVVPLLTRVNCVSDQPDLIICKGDSDETLAVVVLWNRCIEQFVLRVQNLNSNTLFCS